MLHTMLWVPFSLSMATPWPIIVRNYQILSISTILMINKCTPLCKHVASGDITFLGRRQSSTLIISHYSSCRHREKLQNDHHHKWSTYLQQFHLNIKYKIGITNHIAHCLSRPPIATLTTLVAMRPLDGPNSMI